MSSLSQFSLTPVNIDGVAYQAQPEYTSNAVALDYSQSMAIFTNLINLQNSDPQQVINTINSGTYNQQMQAALFGGTVVVGGNPVTVSGLLNLAANGLVDPATGQTNRMTVEMANALDQLLRTLRSANVPLNGSTITSADVISWRSLAETSNVVPTIVQQGLDTSGVDNRTLQALVELVYVNTGNQILSDQLNSLNNALNATSSSLQILNNLQNLHNNLTVSSRISFASAFPTLMGGNYDIGALFMTGNSDFTGFTQAGAQQFRPLDPQVTPISSAELAKFQSSINSLRLEISALSSPSLQPPSSTGASPNTLLGQLRVVYNDIQHAISTSPTSALLIRTSVNATGSVVSIQTMTTLTPDQRLKIAMSRWILDSYSAVPSGGALGNAGAIQQDLTAAITAGQNLNDTQKENVRQYLFVFEEYYKSASSILQKISQIIEKMAQGISR